MTPAARVQAAVEVVDEWRCGTEGIDRVLTRWGRQHRFAGSGDRRAIADLVYDAVRRMRSAAWVAGAEEPAQGRDLLRGSLMLDGVDPEPLFTGESHAQARISEDERHQTRARAAAQRAVRLDLPPCLEPELAEIDDAVLEALRARAPLDLRVNQLKTDPARAMAALAAEGIDAMPVPVSPMALRVRSGERRVAHRVARSRSYREGLVEIQDAASQAVVDLAAAQPGETVLDLCAGGGGKTLALASAMRGRGRLLAHDISPSRMADLPARAARAGAAVQIVGSPALDRLVGACDLVVVDAPCSGSGAWRRNPDAKWRLRPEDLDRLTAVQDALLGQAASLLAAGGRILYATCSILRRENDARVEAFLAGRVGCTVSGRLSLLPPETDGFFAALLLATRSHA